MNKSTLAWKSLLALFASLLWVSLWPEAARAHALLVRSLPAANAVLTLPPSKIEMWFSEELEPGFSGARLFNSTGQEVKTGEVSLDPSDDTHIIVLLDQLDPGIYTVAWQTLSKADGHDYSGSFPITVLNPDGSRPFGGPVDVSGAQQSGLPTPDELLARWLLLLGSMLLFGALLFQTIILPARFPVSRREAAPLEEAVNNLAVMAVWLGALVITLSLGLYLSAQARDLGGFGRLPDLLLGTRSGTLVLARQAVTFTILLLALKLPQPRFVSEHSLAASIVLGLLVVLLAALLVLALLQGGYLVILPSIGVACLGLGLAFWKRGQAAPRTWRKWWAFLAILAGVLLLDISLASHASARLGSFWAVLADFVHLLAASAWVGGLLLLGALLVREFSLPEAERPVSRRLLLLLIHRFSYLASFSVFVLLLSGLFNGLVQIPKISYLWQTTYGQVLLVKIGLIALAMGFALINNRLAHGGENHRMASGALRRRDYPIVLEAGVVLLMMMSVAVLVQTPTPHDTESTDAALQPSPSFNTLVTADDLSLHVQITPNQVGNDRFWVRIYHPDGSPVGEIQLVQLRFNYRDAPLGQAKVDLAPVEKDVFAAEGAYLSQAGAWNLSAYIRRRDIDDTLAQFSLDVPAPSADASALKPWQDPIPAIPPALLVACLILALAAIPVLWRQPLQQAWPGYRFPWRWAALLAFVALTIGTVWLLRSGPSISAGSSPSQAVSLESGKDIYEQQCMSCHGSTGQGDGPAAAGLNPPPANFQLHLAGGNHTDVQIYNWISNGIPYTAMPAFGGTLSEDARWQLVSYLRTLVPVVSP
jgi:copper transport protein